MLKNIDFTSYKTILIAAVIVRIVAAIFSQGYGMHDDHFLIIEASSSWVDGYDYNHWLPWSPGNRGLPEGHSFTYVGLNYLLFSFLKGIGITDPKILMLLNRLIHGLFSVLIVHFSIKITEELSNKKNAALVGWILAMLWVLPFLSVRNLVEVACIPFILWGVFLLLKKRSITQIFYAGLLIGIAVSFRYQVGVFAVGVASVYLFQKELKNFLYFSLGVSLVFILTQGLVDFLIWGYPFAEFLGYFFYNVNEGTEYIPNNNYAMYLLVLMGLFLLPFGLLLGIGFFKTRKAYLILFIPTLLFILFHTFYPSKQERFILPIFPIFLILGIMGYQELLQKDFWRKFWKISIRAFWVLNIPLLLFASFMYSKKSRVEAMYYFYENDTKKEKRLLYEATGETAISMLPKFYSGDWELSSIPRESKDSTLTVYPGYEYDFILFFGEEELQNRTKEYKEIYPQMERVKVCEPSFVDRFLRWLNPRNRNEYIEIWKTNK